MCGGTPEPLLASPPPDGLSPRVRGNPAVVIRAGPHWGSIPACAGEPIARISALRFQPVYPRVCGGTRRLRRLRYAASGLSPRVRGNRVLVGQHHRYSRSIPACAGEPAGALLGALTLKVYPRVCGGTRRRVRFTEAMQGLSPRVRGNPSIPNCGSMITGSIPACAGEPEIIGETVQASTVYPRVCGGTGPASVYCIPMRGLSPRVRGNQIRIQVVPDRTRSIPACAGEPSCGGGWGFAGKVYPRVCGGTFGKQRYRCLVLGLSPRVRGNLEHNPKFLATQRSIPACAGEPQQISKRAPGYGVYPRVCGGTNPRCTDSIPPPGLSPRVRGNRTRSRQSSSYKGSIPACAGEPTRSPGCRSSGTVYPRVCGGTVNSFWP